MTQLTIDLPTDVYNRIHTVAVQQGKLVEDVAREWLVAHSDHAHEDLVSIAPLGERERAIAVLRDAGLLAESGPELKTRAARSTLTLDEARAILDRVGGEPLSDLILEMRGSQT